MGTFHVECWTCRKRVGIEGPEPQFGVDLMWAAHVAGFLAFTDRSRVLVFCSTQCAMKSQTKSGSFRKYRLKED